MGRRKFAVFFALVEATFKYYEGSPTRIIPIRLGKMTGLAGRKLTRADVDDAVSFKDWGGQVDSVIGIYALRTKGVRKSIGPVWRK